MNKQIYYHFLSSKHAIDDLEKKRIRVSTLNTLNDPFEFMPYKRYKFKKRQHYNQIYKSIVKEWGLLCFSNNWHETLLWSHYADKHNGITLGFQISDYDILEVEYSSDPKRQSFKLSKNLYANKRKFVNLAKIKYKKWKYEQEYRILIKLKNCKKDGKKHFILFDNNLKLREIVLGCKFDKNNQKEIEILAKRLGVRLVHTRPGWEDYKIHKDGNFK